MNSIFWHDYETFGANPRIDRPCQFAGIRTDEELNIIGEPVEFFCRPAPDFLPEPGACRVTGISPQQALAKGLSEAAFCARILQEFSEPGTCVAGYNSIRFDDEITRHMLYRCFHDAYEREWKNGNSRWDIIDLLRMTRALRPEGIVWPDKEDGTPSFRLEELTVANGIAHEAAHDALADVTATIAMAKLVKEKQPRLYEFYYNLRNKNRVLPLLDLASKTPAVHISGMFPATRGCIGIVLPLFREPGNNNGIVVLDLLTDPSAWLDMDSETIKAKLYTPSAELPEGESRIALKTIHLNRCPALAPLSVLNAAVIERYGLDMAAVEKHKQGVLNSPGLEAKLMEVFSKQYTDSTTDPEFMLYGGGFFDGHDKRVMADVHRLSPSRLCDLQNEFHDPRLPELLFRFRARNYPETLSAEESLRWQNWCRARLLGEHDGAGVSLAQFKLRLEEERSSLSQTLYEELGDYADSLCHKFNLFTEF